MAGIPAPVPWRAPMRGRNPDEEHRASTPLELFFDLCFVVAVSAAASALHHALATGRVAEGVFGFLVVFFGIWWPWVNFTWFASAYDTDDVSYRLLTFVQMAGVLVIAAGVLSAFEAFDFRVMVVGYVIMRLALVALWLRAAAEDPPGRATARRFALGIGLVQVLWILRLWLVPPWAILGFVVLGIAELLIPVWAERGGRPTQWHADHIAERYGLFTIIVLGECILATTTAIQAALADGGLSAGLLGVAVGGLLLVLAGWWAYFKNSTHIAERRGSARYAFAWGYGHVIVFASAAALGAGLQVAADETHGKIALDPVLAAMTVAVPVAIYLLAVWTLHATEASRATLASVLGGVALVLVIALATPILGLSLAVPAMGLVVVGLITFSRIRAGRRSAPIVPSVARSEGEALAP
jgi:low temperature requirement protein LtrA